MSKHYEILKQAYDAIRSKTDFVPDVALILGSGLGGFADKIKVETTIDYSLIPNFPISTTPGHAGRYIFGYVGDTKVVAMQGRVHYYEGYDIQKVVMPTRLMGMMGAKALFLTNAAGCANLDYNAGDFMLIKDHNLLFYPNPLRGENIDELGERFPDMSEVYTKDLRNIIKDVAKRNDIALKEGIYVQLPGPSFETPAEVAMLGKLGMDAVGMSTACEAVAARHMGLKVCGISCITNKGAGLLDVPLTFDEVKETADRVAPFFTKLVWESIEEIGKYLNK